MKNKLCIFFLIILPVFLFVSAKLLKQVQGPYFLNFYDPSYVYLVNSLNLAQLSGYGVGHFDHPGTTAQVLGAVILKIYYFISNTDPDISRDVLLHPENYLSVINSVFVFINCVTLFLLGVFIFKISGNLILSLLIQLSPFVSAENFYGLIIVTPENLLVFTSLIFIGLLIYYLFRISEKENIPMSFVIIAGIICGFGLVTKLNFVPLVLIPFFIITKFRMKIFFLITLLFAFLIFFSPALSNFGSFLTWLKNLFINSGQYGTGDANVINPNQFLKNISLIFIKDKLFSFTYLICAATLIVAKADKISGINKGLFEVPKVKKLLLLIFVSFNVQIILVAKHYAQYYMIPSFMLCAFALSLCSFIWFEYLIKKSPRVKLNHLLFASILIIFSYSTYKIITSYYEGENQRSEAEKITSFVEKYYANDLLICAFGSANTDCARAFASQYGAVMSPAYKNILKEIQHHNIFYNPWTKTLFTISDVDELKNEIGKSNKIILQINNYGSLNDFTKLLENNFNKKVISSESKFTNGNNESVYEIILQ